MDETKFSDRILSLIRKSLPMQNLQKKLEPVKLIGHRDRYFLVQCRNGNANKKLVFLRFEKWFFYLDGLKEIPDTYETREYTYHTRPEGKKPDPTIKEQREEQERQRIEKANEQIEIQKKQGKIKRVAS